jgi:hypothetical protein
VSRMAKWLLALGVVVALFALAWVTLLPAVVEHELRSITGFDIKVQVLRVNPITGRVVVRGLYARNPTNAGVFMAAFSSPKPAPAGPPPAPAPSTPYLIKHLHIVLDKLVVADFSGGTPDEKTYTLHIDRIYNNVTSARQLFVPDVMQTLRSFGLHHDIASLLPGDFGKALAGAVGDAAALGSGVKDAVKKTSQGLKGFFEKLEQTPKQ